MKKLLLIPALLAGTLAFAEQSKFEISPMIGYNFTEDSLNINDSSYPVVGIEIQANTAESRVSPEFSLLYSQGVDYKSGQDSKFIRAAFNGVYSFDEISIATPFAKLGVGLEHVSNENIDNESGFFVDAGAGVKIPFTDYLALKAEVLYMAKFEPEHSGRFDNNFVGLVGLTFSFGDLEQKEAPVTKTVEEEIVVVEPIPEPIVAAPVVAAVAAPVVVAVVEKDDDKDGVLNSKDSCLATLPGVSVDAKGCNIDKDSDGVLNAKDICPNTLANTKVNSDGCPQTVPLNINFENNSDKIKAESQDQIQKYSDFLQKHTNYSAKIIGYTDSRGSASYNQKLSEKRAAAVVNKLISKGVSASQLTSEGAGEANPIADNASAKGRAQNRRIEAALTRN